MKGKKSKLKRIMVIVAISIVILSLIWALVLRLIILYCAKQVVGELGPAAKYFTEYDLTMPDSEAVQEITINGITVTIPAHFVEIDPIGSSLRYAVVDEEGNPTEQIIFMAPDDVSELNLFSEENIAKMAESPLEKYAVKQLMKGFDDLGNGMPDNYYNMYKAFYLLTEEDYSFLNWKQGFAYVVNGILKNTLAFACDYTYLYETEDNCGFIHVTDKTERNQSNSTLPNYYVVADLLSTDDSSTAYSLLIGCDSLETSYAIINSVVIK